MPIILYLIIKFNILEYYENNHIYNFATHQTITIRQKLDSNKQINGYLHTNSDQIACKSNSYNQIGYKINPQDKKNTKADRDEAQLPHPA